MALVKGSTPDLKHYTKLFPSFIHTIFLPTQSALDCLVTNSGLLRIRIFKNSQSYVKSKEDLQSKISSSLPPGFRWISVAVSIHADHLLWGQDLRVHVGFPWKK